MKKKYKNQIIKYNPKIITIKRCIKPNKDLKKYIDDNIWYARKVYNDFVRIAKDNNEKFDWMKESKKYYNNIEKYLDNYNYYAVGIRANEVKLVKEACDKVRKNRKNKIKSNLHFRRYDPYKGSFRVYCKENNNPYQIALTLQTLPDNKFIYKANKQKRFIIDLQELFGFITKDNFEYYDRHERYSFCDWDYKQVGFTKEINKYYIFIVVEVNMIGNLHDNNSDDDRGEVAGIDLGIRNPITLCYKDYKHKKIRFEKYNIKDFKKTKKLKYLESRIIRLQQIMSRKLLINKQVYGYYYESKNYNKVRKKFRITWKKIYNIINHWRRQLAYMIVNTFKNIVVDEFTIPDKHKKSIINSANRYHGMYSFVEYLRYLCIKYNVNYIDSPKNTTRTCSKCGYENEPLPLSKKKLECFRCGSEIDRDENAALNCYYHYYGKFPIS